MTLKVATAFTCCIVSINVAVTEVASTIKMDADRTKSFKMNGNFMDFMKVILGGHWEIARSLVVRQS